MDANPFAQFAYNGPTRKRLLPLASSAPPPPQPLPLAAQQAPDLDVDALEHILSFVIMGESWVTMCAAMWVNKTWASGAYRAVLRHFGFEKEQAIAFVEGSLHIGSVLLELRLHFEERACELH